MAENTVSRDLLLTYFLIGYCTQLPGFIYGHFLDLTYFTRLRNSGFLAKLVVGTAWLIFTIVLWPTPFIRTGLNYIALELVAIGVLTAYVIVKWASMSLLVALVVIIAGMVSIFLARPGKRWPIIF